MKNPSNVQAEPLQPILASAQGRRRLVLAALRLTENTPITPPAHERALLDRFVDGELTIDEVLLRLEEQ
jgi:hypothetical protein